MKLLPLVLLALTVIARAELTEEQKRNPLEVDAPDPKLTKIVLIAGPTSHAGGQHEYFAGCALMAELLKQTPGVWPVLVGDGWPKNEAVLDHAKSIVVYADAGPKLPLLEPARWAKMKSLMEGGAGLVMLHQTMDVPAENIDDLRNWLGAAFFADIGNRGHWDMELSEVTTHPITRGVAPFSVLGDGWLYNLHFAPAAVAVTAGMVPDKFRTTANSKAHAGRAETIAWAYERPSGGRAFGFTGGDMHKNWGVDPQRKLVVNGILWTAGLEVPEGGAPVALKEGWQSLNLDTKPAKAATGKQ
jgi:type 1 glutamine amidotransferase